MEHLLLEVNVGGRKRRRRRLSPACRLLWSTFNNLIFQLLGVLPLLYQSCDLVSDVLEKIILSSTSKYLISIYGNFLQGSKGQDKLCDIVNERGDIPSQIRCT